VRSPIDENLSITAADELIFSGTEGNSFSGENIKFIAAKKLIIKNGVLLGFFANFSVYNRNSSISQDNGLLNLTAAEGLRLPLWRQIRMSTSPSMTAHSMGYRVCACISSGKLFTVAGNRLCAINPAYC